MTTRETRCSQSGCRLLFSPPLWCSVSRLWRTLRPAGQPIDPDMSKWYQSLKQPGTGTGCCSVADCRPYNSRIVGSHYEILDHQRWLVVPDNVVLHRENKAGAAIACLQTQWNYGFGPPPAGFSPDILCFIPGPEV